MYTRGPDITTEDVQQELQRQPLVLERLVENSLVVAECLRDNYFKNTAKFVAALRRAVARPTDPLLAIDNLTGMSWDTVRGEVVIFIDGGWGM